MRRRPAVRPPGRVPPPGGGAGEPTIRLRLVALVLSVVLPASLILVLGSVGGWEAGRDATERALLARAEALAAAVGRELDLSRAILETLATSPFLAAGDLAGFRRQLDSTPRPEGSRIVLTDATGQMRVNSVFPYGTPLPPRGNLQVVRRVFETGRPQVSDLYTGPMTGDPLVAVDVPVRDAEGQVVHDLSMDFKAERIGHVLAEQRLPVAWIAAVLDGSGRIVARSRGMDLYVGREAAAPSRAAVAAGVNPFTTTTQEGLEARAAHAPIPWAGWTAVIVVPRAALEAPLWRSLALAALGGGGLLLLGLLAAAWHGKRVAQAVHALAAGAGALGQGAPPPPVPPGVREASRAGAALRRAAARLARRGQERDVAERRRGLVVAELNHRVKNMLATVQAIVAQTAKGDPARFAQDLNARLRTLARAHDLLTAKAWEAAELDLVARAALAPWLEQQQPATGDGPPPPRLDLGCAGPMPLLAPHQAQSVVLALHELATNAAKYGGLSRPGGRVGVTCRAGPDGSVTLRWVESGGPPIPEPPVRGGFGTRVLQHALARDLGPGATVELSFLPAGLRAEIRFAPGAQ